LSRARTIGWKSVVMRLRRMMSRSSRVSWRLRCCGVAHGVGGGLHPLIDLALQADLRPVVDAGDADEEADLSLLHGREALAHGVDQLLAQVVGDDVVRRLLGDVFAARLEDDVEARAADEVRGHERLREAYLRLGHDGLADAADELVEESPAVLRLDRLELLDVDVDDAELALLDEHFFQTPEDDRHGRQAAGAVEEERLRGAVRRLDGLDLGATRTVQQRRHALDDLIAVERLDEVLVGAELQAGQTVLHLAAPGDENDADLRRPLHGLERLADVPAAALRHHHVEQDHVGEARLCYGKRLLAIRGDQKLGVERLQVGLEKLHDVLFVIRDEDERPTLHR
jgi:hypothetical protein